MKILAMSVVIIMLFALAVTIFLYLRKKQQKRLDAMTPEQREMIEAEKEYQKNIKQAEKIHKSKLNALDKSVSDCEKALKRAMDKGQQKLGGYKDIQLYEDRIKTSQGTALFVNGSVEATADTAGNLAVTKRVTLTRLVAGGIVGGLIFQKKQKHDSRELYLLVEAPSFQSITECDPDKGSKVRDLAVKINNASKSAEQIRVARNQEITRTTGELNRVKGEVEAGKAEAEQEFIAVKNNTSRLNAARKSLGALAPGQASLEEQ